MSVASVFSMPLLVKELIERAARLRTYLLRVAGAVLLYLFFWFENHRVFSGAGIEPERVLGSGREMFEDLVQMLLIGIYAFVPAMMCGVITQEKERDSLVLLMLTRLSPAKIVLQKFAGGLIPAATLLLLAMPLGGAAYAHGGCTVEQIAAVTLLLFLATAQIAALAVLCSAYFRTTLGAFFATDALACLLTLTVFLPEVIETSIGQNGWTDPIHEIWLAVHIPVALSEVLVFEHAAPAGFIEAGFATVAGSTLVFLAAAIWLLPRRAFLPAGNPLRRLFRAMDAVFGWLNRGVGGVVWRAARQDLPASAPVAWREIRRHAMAQPQHWVRVLVLIEAPVVLICVWMNPGGGPAESLKLSVLAAIVGTMAVVFLGATASNAFVAERVNQTLDVVLATPLAAAEVVRQKARALWRLVVVVAIPVGTIFWFEFLVEGVGSPYRHRASGAEGRVLYAAVALLSLVVYLPLVMWIGIAVGLRSRTHIRAIATTLGIIAAWCVVPLMLLYGYHQVFDYRSVHDYFFLLSPLVLPAINEVGQLDSFGEKPPWVAVLINFAFYGGILAMLRKNSIDRSEELLRR